ncbi:uncharacterized protein L969DRAFT_521044 [Mixia osmundae IAM 14324]|uniref:uncharacterized protein n=1 Tax=Mixia osmundae (strain CBS 9802 / IAM 14324 / JCM 22182 / KY 12970) TaxID=764103 RepID=UPI0004A54F08|nr:uncharacterized protein L969DRAFT_521044 [Mixia osmundae IAM 14324]KEI38265.1 hypothetical protein L969DRAFT_521044 [Mixia osmundae IAM 14324]
MELQPAEPVSATTAGPSSAEQAKAPSAPAPLKTAQQTAITSSPTTARVAGVSKRASVQSRPQSTGSRLSAFFSRSKTSRQSVDADEPRRTSVTSVVSVSPAAVPEPIQAPTETAEIHASQLTPTLGASGARAPSTEDANLQQGDVATPSLQKTDHLDEWQIGASPTGFNLVQVSEQLADLSQATQEPICGVPQLTTSAAALHLQGSLSSSSAASDESSSRRISESETPITDVGVSPFGSSPDPSLRKSRVSSTTTVPEDDEETTEKEMLGIASADSQAALDLICELHPRFEYAMTEFPRRILMGIVKHLDYVDMRPLRDLSKGMRRLLNSDSVRELVVSRYLVSFGYRTLPPELLMSTPHGSATSPTSPSAPKAAPIQISLRDLDAFQVGLEIGLGEYSALARDHRAQPLDAVTQQMLKAATRAWNRVVLRVRSQPPMSADEKRAIIERGITLSSVYRHGRAPLLRVWVPAAGNWMNDDELVECEREVWRQVSLAF